MSRQASTNDDFFAETPIDEFLDIGKALGFAFAPATPNRQPRKPCDAIYWAKREQTK